ncbi:hypothetical protein PVAND_008045 [Polypedilum vanderplanki]|uniref:Enoyl reductase (ER) domain-containing protein n=1 Tax=Polypedilum vanderplanki TaxID=319348 RepID=A0A9J6C9B1_POLVA|nr:hypothetical protein PVAND_008045 [Polypedilum vanderplanki]
MTETSVATTETTPKTPETTTTTTAAEENVENGHGEAEATNGSAEIKEESPKEEVKEDPPKEMKSVVLLSFGGYKGVKVLKKPEPTPQNGEVLIRVRSCGLNFQDLVTRLGAIDSPPKTPTILGFECAGEIEAVGEEVEGLRVGDRVVALPEFRAWAELCVVPAKYVYKLPDDISFSDAAAMAMNYLVAYIIVFDLLSLRPGKSVLLHSAAGGVGLAITQLIRTFEGIKLYGVCSKGKHVEVNDGRFDELIDRSDYVNEIRKISPEGVDIVLDCLCGEDCNRGYGLLKPMGKYVLYGSSNVVTGETKSFFSVARSWWQVDKVSPIKLFDENKTFTGFNLRHFLYQQNGADYCRTVIENVFKLYSEGKIKPVIDSVWAFEDVTDAMQKMHDRKNIGKIILDPAAEPKPKPATPAKTKVKKDKKEKVQSPTNEEEKKVDDTAAAAKETEQNGDSKETIEKPTENGSGDKVEENGKEEIKST